MPARIIDGKQLAEKTRRDVQAGTAELRALGKAVRLVALLVGDSPAARVYADNQAKSCAAVGIDYELCAMEATASQEEVVRRIGRLNDNPAVTGIFLHTPLPAQLDPQRLQYAINILKDVEGVNPANIGHLFYGHTIIAPCTAAAVLEMIDSTGVPVRGADVAVVGASRIAGRPIALLLTARHATVTVCHIDTRDTAAYTRQADIVVVAVGKPGLIGAGDIKSGAVVIDVGINRVSVPQADGTMALRTIGDVRFDEIVEKASHVSPVPGGVGPMTVAMLLKNTLRAARLVHGIIGVGGLGGVPGAE